MKLLVKQNNPAIAGQNQTTFEIPNGTIAALTAILGVVSTAVTILANLLTGLTTNHTTNLSNELKQKNFEVQLLQRVLEIDDPKGRANSVRLLIASDLLKDPDSKISKMIKDTLPKWLPRPLETLDSKLIMYNLEKPNDAKALSEKPKKDSITQ